VGIPFCFLHCGLVLGLCLTVFACAISFFSTYFLMKAKDNCPKKFESYFEIGYATMGRSSIFFIAGCIIASGTGILMIYFIVMGDTMSNIAAQIISGKIPTSGDESVWI
jgi:amino acid permease